MTSEKLWEEAERAWYVRLAEIEEALEHRFKASVNVQLARRLQDMQTKETEKLLRALRMATRRVQRATRMQRRATRHIAATERHYARANDATMMIAPGEEVVLDEARRRLMRRVQSEIEVARVE